MLLTYAGAVNPLRDPEHDTEQENQNETLLSSRSPSSRASRRSARARASAGTSPASALAASFAATSPAPSAGTAPAPQKLELQKEVPQGKIKRRRGSGSELEDVNGFYGADNFKANEGFQEPEQR